VGASVCSAVGDAVGRRVGNHVGLSVGDTVGRRVGVDVGLDVGDTVGKSVSSCVGLNVGIAVRRGVGGGCVAVVLSRNVMVSPTGLKSKTVTIEFRTLPLLYVSVLGY
jgi:hypothetical protein